ncbi:MAG TPA: FAD-dependent 5-carboxymethylaminomethyl-2-thiouridine(34) oxidoreductase MnmC, partial [Alphaproteobacteria bacterium]|nr:FAD-dependent 5-carboxymethylaminomethyl-2-thiouridine(34) oxidoreductase MnmC [Alphaproteobacteria bacterium]
VAVVGGGIAGTSVAAALMVRGIDLDLYEKTDLASGGSGNVRGLFNPRFTAQLGNESDFYSSAFANAVRTFEKIQADSDIGFSRCGSVHLVTDAAKDKRFSGFLQSWGWHEDHARYVSREEASAIAGGAVKHDGVFLPDAGLVAPFKVVGALAAHVNVIQKEILSLEELRDYDVVVLAGAADILKFPQAAFLPVSTVRGQVSIIETPAAFSALKTNLCYGGYASLPFDGQMVVGSTFQPWIDDLVIRDEDHIDVLQKLSDVVDGFDGIATVTGARAAFRCASKDRVPVIGEIDSNLYVSVAHGSHGLITSLLGAEMIAAQMTGEISPVPQNVVRYVSPDRFRTLQASRRTSSR